MVNLELFYNCLFDIDHIRFVFLPHHDKEHREPNFKPNQLVGRVIMDGAKSKFVCPTPLEYKIDFNIAAKTKSKPDPSDVPKAKKKP